MLRGKLFTIVTKGDPRFAVSFVVDWEVGRVPTVAMGDPIVRAVVDTVEQGID